jgi:hypothetical protein
VSNGCSHGRCGGGAANNNNGNGNVMPAPTVIVGCTDSAANNYNSAATQDNGSCTYDVFGCMDRGAMNFNPLAN